MADEQTQDDSDYTNQPNPVISQLIQALHSSSPSFQSPYQQTRAYSPPQQPPMPRPQQQPAPQMQPQQMQRPQMAQQQPPQPEVEKVTRETQQEGGEQNVWQKIYSALQDQNPGATPKQLLYSMKLFKDSGAFEIYGKQSGKTTETTTTSKSGGDWSKTGKTVDEQLYASLIKNGLQPTDAARIVQESRGTGVGTAGEKEAAKQKAITDAIAGKESASAIGKARGAEEISYAKMQAGMPGIEKAIKSLSNLANTANYTIPQELLADSRRQLGLSVSQGAIDAAQYESVLNNILLPRLRSIFGARVTNFDVTAAAKMLGNPKLSPPEKQVQLQSFIDQAIENVKTEGETVKALGGKPSPEMKDEETPSSSGEAVDYTEYFK